MLMALTAAMVSWIYTYFQTHQVVYINYVQLFVCQSFLSDKYLLLYYITSNLHVSSSSAPREVSQ